MLQAADLTATEPAAAVPQKLIAESYAPPNPGPYPQDKPPENTVRFTPVQVRHSPALSCLAKPYCNMQGDHLTCLVWLYGCAATGKP